MLKNFIKIITSKCEVIKLDNKIIVYPIFKNGSSSLDAYAYQNNLSRYHNRSISKFKNIMVFLREPNERFISGVHTFFYHNYSQHMDKKVLESIENFSIVDRHFVPQYFWLLHLFKYYKGFVDIRPVSDLYRLIPNRSGPWNHGPKWTPLTKKDKSKICEINYEKYVNVDLKIIEKYMNKSVKLENIIKEFKNEVS